MNKQGQENLRLAQLPAVRKMLDAISAAEGTSQYGYATAFGGKPLKSLSGHPGTRSQFDQTDGKKNVTTAAGRYQFVKPTWDGLSKQLGLKDFEKDAQDAAAVQLLREKGALDDAVKGNYQAAINKVGVIWAGLPSSPHQQPKKSWEYMSKAMGVPLQGDYPEPGPVRGAKPQAVMLAAQEIDMGLPPNTLLRQEESATSAAPAFAPLQTANPLPDWQQKLAELEAQTAPPSRQTLRTAAVADDTPSLAFGAELEAAASAAQQNALNRMFSDIASSAPQQNMELPAGVDRYLDKMLA